MDTYWILFIGLLVRWLHVVAGIAWIGSSFCFSWLDRSLEPPEPGSQEARKGVGGQLWAVHGGGVYNPQKYTVAPARLPPGCTVPGGGLPDLVVRDSPARPGVLAPAGR